MHCCCLTERVSSMVNTHLSQSTLLPMRLSWVQMRPPYSSTHLNTSDRNTSRPGGGGMIQEHDAMVSHECTYMCVNQRAGFGMQLPGTGPDHRAT
jgi:hypothetical protein